MTDKREIYRTKLKYGQRSSHTALTRGLHKDKITTKTVTTKPFPALVRFARYKSITLTILTTLMPFTKLSSRNKIPAVKDKIKDNGADPGLESKSI